MSLRIMTLNLRNPNDRPPHDWDSRRPLVAELIGRWRPDLIGTQEGFYHQVRHVAEDTGYAWLGTGRDGGSRSEFMAIYYRAERFEPLAFDHFWLSDTPEVVASRSWGNDNVRMATWVLFRDRETGRRLYHLNTHLDHAVAEARRLGAELIVERARGLEADAPVIVTGDFNAAPETSEAYQALVGPDRFWDTWPAAAERPEEVGTYHGWDGPRPGVPRIDWILLRGGATVERVLIDIDQYQGAWPSDHCAYLADVRLI